jgi:nucleoside-diphosphate-sugar epimerase
MRNKILLLGSTGFIGSKLLELLLAKSYTILAVTRSNQHSFNPNIEYVDFDLLFSQQSHKLYTLNKVTHIINCIGEVENEQNMVEMNIGIVTKILKIANQFQIPNIIHLGSAGIYRKEGKIAVDSVIEPTNFYEWSKFSADQLLESGRGISNIQIIRPTTVIGHGMKAGSFKQLIRFYSSVGYVHFKSLKKTYFHYVSVDVLIDVIHRCVVGELKNEILLVSTDLNQLDFSTCFPVKVRTFYIPLFFLKPFFFFNIGLKRRQFQYLIEEAFFESNIEKLNDKHYKLDSIKQVILDLNVSNEYV